MARYFIEQAPDRFYDESELASAKARARRLSQTRDDGVYLIAEAFDGEVMDYRPIGSIAFYNGRQDAREGSFAEVR